MAKTYVMSCISNIDSQAKAKAISSLCESKPTATHPDDCHPGVESIISNAALVDLLLVRHYKKWGGLVLPPLQAARGLQDAYEVFAEQEKQRGLTWASGRSLMKYPNW
jgi:hypothetical protein